MQFIIISRSKSCCISQRQGGYQCSLPVSERVVCPGYPVMQLAVVLCACAHKGHLVWSVPACSAHASPRPPSTAPVTLLVVHHPVAHAAHAAHHRHGSKAHSSIAHTTHAAHHAVAHAHAVATAASHAITAAAATTITTTATAITSATTTAHATTIATSIAATATVATTTSIATITTPLLLAWDCLLDLHSAAIECVRHAQHLPNGCLVRKRHETKPTTGVVRHT
mmetsp:Transcript_27044/g.59128  ORF Transcript_27044/g.59128 Transcript_27044/m.59128 type:complete len:225 (-) Transcript_27044:595-1269(-)